MTKFRSIVLLAAAALSLSACQTTGGGIPASPGEVANRTVLDERAGIAADTAYLAANRAAALAIRAGIVTDTATIKRIGEIDLKAKAAVAKVRAAYDASNAASYDAALREADALTKQLLGQF